MNPINLDTYSDRVKQNKRKSYREKQRWLSCSSTNLRSTNSSNNFWANRMKWKLANPNLQTQFNICLVEDRVPISVSSTKKNKLEQ